jgi:hypothetical protein
MSPSAETAISLSLKSLPVRSPASRSAMNAAYGVFASYTTSDATSVYGIPFSCATSSVVRLDFPKAYVPEETAAAAAAPLVALVSCTSRPKRLKSPECWP